MVTMQQRIEALRTEKGLSRPALAAALGLPKGSVDKFETGRQTPTKEQQEKWPPFLPFPCFIYAAKATTAPKWNTGPTWTRRISWTRPSPPRLPPPRCPKASDCSRTRRRQQHVRHISAQQILSGNDPRHASGCASFSGRAAYPIRRAAPPEINARRPALPCRAEKQPSQLHSIIRFCPPARICSVLKRPPLYTTAAVLFVVVQKQMLSPSGRETVLC